MSYLFHISALVLGFGSSLHCAGMCGPLVISMPFNQVKNKLLAVLSYLLAKAFAYSVLGILIGIIGKSFAVLALQKALSITAGSFVIFFALVPGLLRNIKMPFILRKGLADSFSDVLARPSLNHFFAFGFFNGLVPCAMVYSALAAAAATTTAWWASLYMFLFGIGNTPALIALIFVKSRVSLPVRKRLTKFSLLIMLATGMMLMFRSIRSSHYHAGTEHSGSAIECTQAK